MISDIRYLLWFKNDNDTCEGSNRNGGNFAVAISKASSIGFGFTGFSAGNPYWTLNSPVFVRYILSILPTKNDTLALNDSSDANILAAEFPDWSNFLPKNSNGALTFSATV